MRKSHRHGFATTRDDGTWASLDKHGGTKCDHKHRTSDAAFSCSRDRQHNGGINP